MSDGFKKIFLLLILLIIILLVFAVFYYNSSEKVVYGKDELYDKVEEYLISLEEPHYFSETKYSEPNTDISDFKVFTDIAKLGVRKKGDEIYVYVWALVESYYVQEGKLISNSGSSMAYRFTIINNEIVKYQNPKDGSEYLPSLKKIFPIDIRLKMGDGVSLVDSTALDRAVKEHYSYINSNEI